MSKHAARTTEPFIVTPQKYDPALNVIGTKVTVLASKAATQSYEITLQQGDEGMGPPLHSHNWDESFFILKGQVEFSCADNITLCMPGTLVHVPAGAKHGFRYGAGGGQMLEFTGPGSLASQMFTALNREIPPGPRDIPKVLEVLQQNGVTVAA